MQLLVEKQSSHEWMYLFNLEEVFVRFSRRLYYHTVHRSSINAFGVMQTNLHILQAIVCVLHLPGSSSHTSSEFSYLKGVCLDTVILMHYSACTRSVILDCYPSRF